MPPPKRRAAQLDRLEAKAIARFKREPASFEDLVDEGLFDRQTARSIQIRLQKKGLIRVFAQRGGGLPGRPRVIWAWVK